MRGVLEAHDGRDVVAFDTRGERTGADLRRHAAGIAERLSGVPADRAVVACADRYHFAAALVACWSRGLAVALPPNGQADAVHALADGPGVAALLHDFDRRPGLDVRGLDVRGLEGESPVATRLAPDQVAAIAHTSGSTGEPAAHPKTLQQLLGETAALIESFGLHGRRITGAVPPHHIYGLLFGVLVPLCGGGAMSRHSPLQAAEVLATLRACRADVLVAVPPHLRSLVQHAEPLPALHRVFSSGAPLPDEVAELLAQRGVPVTQVLGSTETGGIAHRSRPGAWTPLPGGAWLRPRTGPCYSRGHGSTPTPACPCAARTASPCRAKALRTWAGWTRWSRWGAGVWT